MQFLLNRILWSGLAALFFSCSGESQSTANTDNEKEPQEIVVSPGIISTSAHIGSVKMDGDEYLYFANFKSENKVKVFYDFDSIYCEINLDTLTKISESVENMWFFSMDTIILNTAYTNRLFFFNSKGHLWKTVDLNNQLKDDSSHFEIMSAFCNNTYHNPPIYAAESRLDKYRSLRGKQLDQIDRIKQFDFNSSRKSLLVQIDSISTKAPIVNTSELTPYRLISDKAEQGLLMFNYVAYHNNFTYFAFAHSPYIYKLDENLDIIDSILITHSITKTYVEPVFYDKHSYQTMGSKLDSLISFGGFIGSLSTYKNFLIVGIISNDKKNRIAIVNLNNENKIRWIDTEPESTVVVIPFKDKLYIKKRETPENLKNQTINFYVHEITG